MPVTTKNRNTSTSSKKISAPADSKVGNYEKHPFFVKKANEARAILKEVGLPKKVKSK